jgi:RNA polymerase subunit RPABC4/transcription elongation factor Spt4
VIERQTYRCEYTNYVTVSGNWRRTGLVVVLAVLFPGLGHAYLRKWVRALLWAGSFLMVAALVLPPIPTSGGVLESTQALLEATSTGATVALSAIQLFNAIDAGTIAAQGETNETTDEPDRCPNCRKELDEELDFCPWCTTRLDDGNASETVSN